ncbi:MAG: UvrD-helicase domain-containing protein [Armatimonadetes bacterium]|nr:UvrD-helicase domain-containing protein [Armatimonadota bacterium]
MGERRTVPWLCDENGNPLDERQIELAMFDDANLIVNAGPGSGKTRVLVAHYLELLMRHISWDVESVVAITFTEKAAAEMKERISRVLLRSRQEVSCLEWSHRVEEILEHLPEAPIGTIHSFCARLLRKFALEAGVDPSFRILDELEAQTLRTEVCKRWLWSKLSDTSDPIALDAQKVVGHWGFNRAVELLEGMLKTRLLIEHRKEKGEPILHRVGELEEPELALERCYECVAKAYDDEKTSINALDYDDLLLRTWKLLKTNEEVRNRIRQTYRRILVDELQDTDRVQVEILSLICGWDSDKPKEVKFFGVGDSQQSIYGFRNADVSVFNELWNQAKSRFGWRRESLDKNYRSVPALVELTNYAFERIFRVSESPEEVEQRVRMPLQPMKAVRKSDISTPIEFAFFKIKGNPSKWRKLRLEAEWIAKRICELHECGISYSDIALLLRDLVNASAFEDALRRYGIPYHIITGYGFFETMEARDLLNFLRVLAEPDNDLALAAWLRSPMVGVMDETLFAIFGTNSNALLWLRGILTDDDLELPLPDSEREKLKRARTLLKESQERVDKVSIRELLEWVIRETSYDVIVAALPHGKQRLANIRKFVRMAQQLSEDMKLNVRGLTRYAQALVEGEVRIGEPPLAGAKAEAVQIMTIHAAKGLEFPVVILPMLGEVSKPGGTKESIIATPEVGLAVRLRDESGEGRRTERFEAVDKVRQIRETAELERLLFVAWTRAKDRLILVGTQSENSQQKQKTQKQWGTWLQLVADTLQVPIGEKRDEPFPIAGKIPVLLMGETVKETDLPQKIGKPAVSDTEAAKWLEHPATIPKVELPEPIDLDLPSREPSVLKLNVTDLVEFELEAMQTRSSPTLTELSPIEAGLIVHQCLQRGLTSLSDKQILWLAQTVGADPNAALRDAETLSKFLANAYKSDAWRYAESAPKKWRELDFRIWIDPKGEHPPIELAGRLDLLVMGDEWLVVDFKTDRVASFEEAKSRVDNQYLTQAQAYALAVHLVFGAESVKVAFVFVNSSEPFEVKLEFKSEDWEDIAESLRLKSLCYVSKSQQTLSKP